MNSSSDFWSQRYEHGQTGWDLGRVSPPIQSYVDQLRRKDIQILIPGAGNGHEAEYLHRQGFNQVHVLDIAREPLENLLRRVPDFPRERLHHGDFFAHEGRYHLILEQTFFCALTPARRGEYAEKMHELLLDDGKLAGVLFDFPLVTQGPPFGGSKEEYLGYFEPHFAVETLERCYNSVPGRQGSELFVKLRKEPVS